MVAKGRRFVQLLPATLTLLPRGYTSHEHLDKLGLIHMNGRVYDPELGRFLSADPLIQFPESTQGFDRYAYVGNSPLSYTDPSGHGLLGIVGSIVSFFYPPVGALLIAVDGYLEGGLQGALFSVASMAAAAGVGDMFGPVGNFGHELARAAVHGLIQGALGAAQGGKFGAAFLAAGVTSGYGSSGLGQIGNRVTRVISAAVLGGTVSKIGGGKFANGAATGAFVQAFNHDAHQDSSDDGRAGTRDEARAKAYKQMPYGRGERNEWGTVIADAGDGTYAISGPIPGGPDSVPFGDFGVFVYDGQAYVMSGDMPLRVVELAHTHPIGGNGSQFFSAPTRSDLGDAGIAEAGNVDVSMRYKSALRIYEPTAMQPTRPAGGPVGTTAGRVLCAKNCF